MVLLFHNRLSSAAAGAIAIAVVTAQPITPPFAAAQSAALAFAIATSQAAADGARAAIRDPRLLVLVLALVVDDLIFHHFLRKIYLRSFLGVAIKDCAFADGVVCNTKKLLKAG